MTDDCPNCRLVPFDEALSRDIEGPIDPERAGVWERCSKHKTPDREEEL